MEPIGLNFDQGYVKTDYAQSPLGAQLSIWIDYKSQPGTELNIYLFLKRGPICKKKITICKRAHKGKPGFIHDNHSFTHMPMAFIPEFEKLHLHLLSPCLVNVGFLANI